MVDPPYWATVELLFSEFGAGFGNGCLFAQRTISRPAATEIINSPQSFAPFKRSTPE
jgi:hypothetical protein